MIEIECTHWKHRLGISLAKFIHDNIGDPKRGVELGVNTGHTSRVLLESFPELHLAMVDPWLECPEARNKATSNVEQYIDRTQIIQLPSRSAVSDALGRGLDFVFIDADHSYNAVKYDISVWRKAVRRGGLLCGHDYGDRNLFPGVEKAVRESFEADRIMTTERSIWGVIIK
jgi:predicted O-methyltransferase YrrM